MKPDTKVFVEPRASAVIATLTPAQREQFMRLIAAIRIAPQAGVYAGHDDRGRPLWQVSGADVHLIYLVVYRTAGDRVFVVAIDVAPWEPIHADMP